MDHTFYRPATVEQLAHYAAQVPSGFEFCCKVWEELTIPVYAKQERYGAKAGTVNARFLDASLFEDLVLAPTREGLGERAGPFIFEFQRSGPEATTFLDRLDRFLAALLPGSRYAIEVRNPAVLGDRYRDILRAHGAGHVYNHWTAMPSPARQHAALGGVFTAPFLVVRLLTPLHLPYEWAVERAAPYDRIVEPLPRMRAETVELIRHAAAEQQQTYVPVNNRAEGNAPMTVQAIVDLLLGTDAPRADHRASRPDDDTPRA